ncbi:MAG: hypothetical protein DID91_2727704449 [Candidatus Nitrotoga sp. MKT]|nr:MAG: hypothetical protein DID91_2727704449 [Candidatus Nitrotoga sp. MKT]
MNFKTDKQGYDAVYSIYFNAHGHPPKNTPHNIRVKINFNLIKLVEAV